jgi:hypothetical protein
MLELRPTDDSLDGVTSFADRAKYYRSVAAFTRSQADQTKPAEAQDELIRLAVEYEEHAMLLELAAALD